MKALYKYPQSEYPYGHLEAVNRQRNVEEPEFELEDTGTVGSSELRPPRDGPKLVLIRVL